MVDFAITGNQFVDAIILSQIIATITGYIGHIVNMILACIRSVYSFIIGRIMITLYVKEHIDYMSDYLDKLCKETEKDELYGNNVLQIDNSKLSSNWFEKILYTPLEISYDKFSINCVLRKRIVFNGRYIWIIKTENRDKDQIFRMYNLMVLNWNINKSFFKNFFIHLENKYKLPAETKDVSIRYRIYRTDHRCWLTYYRAGRTFDSVYLKPHIKQEIMADYAMFKNSKKFYNEHSIPYQRGWLLHGYPGTGKSSIIKALATEESMTILSIKLSDKYITDSTLEQILLDATPGIFIFEDIDVIFKKDNVIIDKKPSKDDGDNSDDDKQKGGALTYSGFINILSGINDVFNGSIIVMTTNNYDRIPASLIRPGRIDKIWHIGYADVDQIEQLLRAFQPELSEGDYKLIPKMIIDKDAQLTIAVLQNYFIKYRTIDEIVKNLNNIREI